MTYELSKTSSILNGSITLNGSKSLANRALLIRALCAEDFPIEALSNSKDTQTLDALLRQSDDHYDTGAAGTTYRFLTAYLALESGTQTLTGSERMLQRPIGILVDALRQLGAQIDYLGEEGYPPLRLHSPKHTTQTQLQIPAHTSSQYISALLMIAPTLPNGLELQLVGKVVSRPYIEMTLRLMAYFGVAHTWEGDTIYIAPQVYQAQAFRVEADWSAASYYYSLLALSEGGELELIGLQQDSLQGDAVLVDFMRAFGVETNFTATGIRLQKSETALPKYFEYDFVRCPDLAQTVAVLCGGLGVTARLTGLETLRIKETDRIAALQEELAKVKVQVKVLDQNSIEIKGKASLQSMPTFATYEDHRMAMAFAPLAMLGKLRIADPLVVEKSYPAFWKDLEQLNITASQIG